MVDTAMTEHSWLRAIACVSCGFHLRNARNASDCVWMETGLNDVHAANCAMIMHGRQRHPTYDHVHHPVHVQVNVNVKVNVQFGDCAFPVAAPRKHLEPFAYVSPGRNVLIDVSS